MGILSRENYIRQFRENNPSIHNYVTYSLPSIYRDLDLPRVDINSAVETYNALRQVVSFYGYLPGKVLRPWTVDPAINDANDKSEPWWGWEFETGFVSQEARSSIVEEVWDNFDNVSFDAEGDGRFNSEITFSPQNVSKYRDGTADAIRFMELISANKDKMLRSDNYFVGTHLNVSLPSTENIISTDSWLAQAINTSLALLTEEEAFKLFGRSQLYGGCYTRRDSRSRWFEFKTFRTTYDAEVFKKYMKVADALTYTLLLINTLYKKSAKSVVITNMKDMLEDDFKPDARRVRMGYTISGDARTRRFVASSSNGRVGAISKENVLALLKKED